MNAKEIFDNKIKTGWYENYSDEMLQVLYDDCKYQADFINLLEKQTDLLREIDTILADNYKLLKNIDKRMRK